MSRSRKWLVGASVLLLAAAAEYSCRSGPLLQLNSSPVPVAAQAQAPAEVEASLRAIIEAGRLDALRWPDFSDYRASVRDFYERNHHALAWFKGGEPSSQALALITLLQQSGSKGLNPEDYDAARWQQRLARLQPGSFPGEAERAAFDVSLTVSAMRYASDLSIGRVNPRELNCGFDVEQNRCDLAPFLLRVAQASDVASVFRELDPPFAIYRRTEDALERYRQLAREDNQPALAPLRKTIKPGDSYPDAPALARYLRELGDLHDELAFSAPPVYEGPLATAVQRFQRRHGLETNGWITSRTLAALEVPLAQRVLQLELALERLRWLPRKFSHPPIMVNIPVFRLHALNEDFKSEWDTSVVVGKAYQYRTPIFTAEMRYVIFRPYWDVPNSIARKELLPKIEEDPAYLRENDYEIVTRGGHVLDENQINADVLAEVRAGELRIRQRPGEKNALGLVKFVFPNEHDVYMHSTPAIELFARSRRDFSHGCIRVQDAAELAAWCLQDNSGWSAERIHTAMQGLETLRVELKRPIQVLIVYITATVSARGEVHFYSDIYGYDPELEKALARHHP